MKYLQQKFVLFSLLSAVVVSGCEGLSDPPPKEDPFNNTSDKNKVEPYVPPLGREPKVAALPDLPEGAGEMDADVGDELIPHESGIYYRILRKGEGRKPAVEDGVVVHYKGWLDDGTVFDSSYKSGRPTSFPLTRVVMGWRHGLPLIGEGGMIELEIPYQLGYGVMGYGPSIPPKMTLHFIVELKKVNPASQDQPN